MIHELVWGGYATTVDTFTDSDGEMCIRFTQDAFVEGDQDVVILHASVFREIASKVALQ